MTNPFKNWDATKVSEHNQRVANHKAVAKTIVTSAELVAGTRVRQSHKEPSKIHRDWGELLKFKHSESNVYEEAITLKLCNGVRYSPDWCLAEWNGNGAYRLTAFEVKGFMRDDARKSLLFAAKEYPWIKFVLVWRERGEWRQQEIVP